jgi:hypothetical protein
MNSNQENDLAFFAKAYLEYHGAYTEQQADGIEALLPRQLAGELAVKDHIHMSAGFSERRNENLEIAYGSPFLDRLLAHALDQPALVCRQIRFHYIKSAGFEQLIKNTFRFHNAVFSIAQTAEIQSEYIIFACRYLAQSDEQKQGLIFPSVNIGTGAALFGLDRQLAYGELLPWQKPPSLDDHKRGRVMAWLKPMIEKAVAEDLTDFTDSMNRRYNRDVKNLSEYYESLAAEMKESLERPGLAPQSIRDRQEKIALIPEEAKRKKQDLLKKYSIQVKITPAAAMRILAPTVKVFCACKIGRDSKDIVLLYNPILKAVEPFVCPVCHKSGFHIIFNSNQQPRCESCG